jgi:hypothetical protein
VVHEPATRQLRLNLFIHGRGHHEAAWRHPTASPLPLTDIGYYTDLVQKAEAGLFDSVFLADTLGGRRLRGTRAAHVAGTRHHPRCSGRRHLPRRPDRHLLHDLHRAVHPGTPRIICAW